MRSLFIAGSLAGLFMLAGCGRADPTLLPPDASGPGGLVIESAQVLQAESWPVQVFLELTGSLPSACHDLEYSVDLTRTDGVIVVEAEAVLDEGAECEPGAQPFRQGIGLGSYTDASFQVSLNGELVGEFAIGDGAQGADPLDGFELGPVFIEDAEILLLESFPVQVELLIQGALPTPCASLEWSAESPDENGRIMVEVFSLQDPALDCIQVLEEIEERLPLGSYEEGTYSVWLNGELVGEFDI